MEIMKESSGKREIYLVLGRSCRVVSSRTPRVLRELDDWRLRMKWRCVGKNEKVNPRVSYL